MTRQKYNSSNYILGGGKLACGSVGCEKRGGIFGYCKDHKARPVGKQFLKAVADGRAQQETPRCFNSGEDYREYVVLWVQAEPTHNLEVSICRDCTPEYRTQMAAERRCAQPETVFIRDAQRGDPLVGVPLVKGKPTASWEKAAMGMAGPVVGMPDQGALDLAFRDIAIANQPKPRGRRPRIS